jgi:hypothetical protein
MCGHIMHVSLGIKFGRVSNCGVPKIAKEKE